MLDPYLVQSFIVFRGGKRYIDLKENGTPLLHLFQIDHFNCKEFKDMAAPNMQAMMKQVQQMQDRMAKVQAELEQKLTTAEVGGGMIKATVNGKQQVVKIQIEKEVINPADSEMLEDLVVAAVNKALDESQKMAQEEMNKVTAGMMPKIPGLNFPGF